MPPVPEDVLNSHQKQDVDMVVEDDSVKNEPTEEIVEKNLTDAEDGQVIFLSIYSILMSFFC